MTKKHFNTSKENKSHLKKNFSEINLRTWRYLVIEREFRSKIHQSLHTVWFHLYNNEKEIKYVYRYQIISVNITVFLSEVLV